MKNNLSLYSLPDELLLDVRDQTGKTADLNSLAQTCHRLHDVLNDSVYKRNCDGGSGLQRAAQKGNISAARKLLLTGTDINAQRRVTPRRCTSHRPAQAETCVICLFLNMHRAERRLSALHVACMYDQVEMVQFLIDHGASPDIMSYAVPSPSQLAVIYANPTSLSRLTANGMSELSGPPSNAFGTLFVFSVMALNEEASIQHRRAETIKLLLDLGAPRNGLHQLMRWRQFKTLPALTDNDLMIKHLESRLGAYKIELMKRGSLFLEDAKIPRIVEFVWQDHQRKLIETLFQTKSLL